MRRNLAWSHTLTGPRRMSHTLTGYRPAGALIAFRLALALALTLALALLGTCAHAATITIVNLD